ncbi:MAG: hypothetical protein MRQ13_04545 [Candidatus Midichloria sp.]|nr:hypothetical protein [Candidatus Midichloria sp.]
MFLNPTQNPEVARLQREYSRCTMYCEHGVQYIVKMQKVRGFEKRATILMRLKPTLEGERYEGLKEVM